MIDTQITRGAEITCLLLITEHYFQEVRQKHFLEDAKRRVGTEMTLDRTDYFVVGIQRKLIDGIDLGTLNLPTK